MFVMYLLGYITHDTGCGKVGIHYVRCSADYLEALTMATGLNGVSESLWIVPGTIGE